MICVKVDKAPRSASSRRSQCPSARRPPTLRNSYITITSCTYHKIRSRASDLETSSSRTRSPLSHPLNPSSVTDADSATSTKCSIIHVNRSAQGRRRLMTMMTTTSLRPRQGWTTFSSFIQKEAVPLMSEIVLPLPSFGITRHWPGPGSRGRLHVCVHGLVGRRGGRHRGLLLVGFVLLLHLAAWGENQFG